MEETKKYYEIHWGYSTSDLSEKIQKRLDFGWEPIGGVSESSGINGDKILIQAIWKQEKQKK